MGDIAANLLRMFYSMMEKPLRDNVQGCSSVLSGGTG